MKKIGIIGSTGSIGVQTLDIIRQNKDIQVNTLAAYSNIDLLEKQIREFRPKIACVYLEDKKNELKDRIKDIDVKLYSGIDGLIEVCVDKDIDMVVTAIVGMVGVRPTIEAIKAGKDIALANKETMVVAGHIIIDLAKQKHVNIYPIDSEHSAIFQSIRAGEKNEIEKIILTASGGPFRGKKKHELLSVTKEQALNHPNWKMGAKITIDSATMVNKGLEIIEARWLFDIKVNNIEVVVHPQSIIHSMVEFKDGAVISQMGTPDMHLPISYALYYPNRKYLKGDRLDFLSGMNLSFEKPDEETFRGLYLAKKAIEIGGSMPTVFNAANEVAVDMFLKDKISFLNIAEFIEDKMNMHKVIDSPSIFEILDIESDIRDEKRY